MRNIDADKLLELQDNSNVKSLYINMVKDIMMLQPPFTSTPLEIFNEATRVVSDPDG